MAYELQVAKKKWSDFESISTTMFATSLVDDSLGAINVSVVKRVRDHELELLSDILDKLIVTHPKFDYIDFSNQGIYISGCEHILETLINIDGIPKILNLAQNKVLEGLFNNNIIHQFLNSDHLIWLNLTNNYCMDNKKLFMELHPNLILKIIFIEENELDRHWQYMIREDPHVPICQKLEDAIYQSHIAYYRILKHEIKKL